MAASSNKSRVEPGSRSTAKPIASPRAEMHARPADAKASAKKSSAGVKTSPKNKKPAVGKAKLVTSKLVFKGKVFNVFTDTVIEPGGHKTTRDVIRHNGSVVILAVDESSKPADPDVILERQYRHAAAQYLIEVPAGTRDADEAPLAAAKRELTEETGYTAKRWTMLAKYYASPGFLGEWMQVYLARDLREGAATPEEDENLEVFRLPLSQAMHMVAAGEIHDGKTLIALSLYDAARRDGRI
jgi:ADP-ribose pyrophosphatase